MLYRRKILYDLHESHVSQFILNITLIFSRRVQISYKSRFSRDLDTSLLLLYCSFLLFQFIVLQQEIIILLTIGDHPIECLKKTNV